MEKVILERHKPTNYIVNFEGKKYVWSGSKGNLISKKEVPIEVYDYLAMFTCAFQRGELILSAKTEEEKELIDNLVDKESYEANALKKDDVKSLLNGNLNKMKKELSKITLHSTKQFVLEVAKEIPITNANKQKFIKEWIGSSLSIEDIFPMEDE